MTGLISRLQIRKALHFVLNSLIFVPWLLAYLFCYIVIKGAVLGHKIWPEADRGSCFSYTLPRWNKYGGKLTVERSPYIPFIPRLEWIDKEGKVSYVRPVAPVRNWWQAWRTVYFKYKEKHK